jgi:formylmethanofuran dehydrogenase subunit C
MTWLLRARNDAIPADRVEARSLVSALQSAGSLAEAISIPVNVGNVTVSLDSLVRVDQGTDGDEVIRLIGDFSRWNGLGFGMRTGRLIVEGDTGTRTAAELAGGFVEIHGDCGAWAGAAAVSGRLIVRGRAGDWLGANWPGETRGMTGGEIFVHGDAGCHAGARMRRGTIAVGGTAGSGVGRAMIAGSVIVAGPVQGTVGLGMKRGTIVLGAANFEKPPVSDAGFPEAGTFRPLTLHIQLRHALKAEWLPSDEMLAALSAKRYMGDRLVQGQGEILVLSGSANHQRAKS